MFITWGTTQFQPLVMIILLSIHLLWGGDVVTGVVIGFVKEVVVISVVLEVVISDVVVRVCKVDWVDEVVAADNNTVTWLSAPTFDLMNDEAFVKKLINRLYL